MQLMSTLGQSSLQESPPDPPQRAGDKPTLCRFNWTKACCSSSLAQKKMSFMTTEHTRRLDDSTHTSERVSNHPGYSPVALAYTTFWGFFLHLLPVLFSTAVVMPLKSPAGTKASVRRGTRGLSNCHPFGESPDMTLCCVVGCWALTEEREQGACTRLQLRSGQQLPNVDCYTS